MNLSALTTQLHREHDACGIFAWIDKTGGHSRKPVEFGIQALRALRHRAGYVHGEGDGCGLLLDIPRKLWRRWLQDAGHEQMLADDERFFVLHLFLQRADWEGRWTRIEQKLAASGVTVLVARTDAADRDALGPSARREDPVFVQVGGLTPDGDNALLYRLTVALEGIPGVHVVSMSRDTAVYKVVGDGDTLWAYYPDLRHPLFTSGYVLAHTRYSTNTATSFSRVQPFSALGHNGEINTITRFYAEAHMIDIPLDAGYSDSQMVNGVVDHFTKERGWSLFEVAELLFPPIINEIKQMPAELADLYMFYRALWGPFAQGPAAMMLRAGREAVFCIDALGLRPMWLLETADGYAFSSEQGIVPVSEWVADPKPLAPGEKIGAELGPDGVRLYLYTDLQRVVLERARQRYAFRGQSETLRFAGAVPDADAVHPARDGKPRLVRAAAFGWRDDDLKMLDFEVHSGAEPIRSLGYDGPLPALDPGVKQLSDFLQETVAVVTNPAIDREREIEHFSTRSLIGKRPSFEGLYQEAPRVETQSPLLLEELPADLDVQRDDVRAIAHRHGTLCYEDALAALRTDPYGTVEILIHREPGETLQQALERFRQEALEAVQAGAHALVLDDRLQFARGEWVDPLLALAVVHRALLRPASKRGGEHLRRRTSIILRSGGIRNLHDIMTAIGLGADAVNPYLMWEFAAEKASVAGLENLYVALCKGVEKVISTIGIHEVRGYERLFSGIGLAPEVAELLAVPNFCGGEGAGYGLVQLEEEAVKRRQVYDAADERQVAKNRVFQLYPRIWKSAGMVATGHTSYEEFEEKLLSFEREHPINIKHLLRLRETVGEAQAVDAGEIDTTIDGHAYPLVISSMSFGSQSEVAYRAYAEAAYRLNIVGLNGEGGEIKDILTKYPRNRGRQVASGRFGVNAELCNGAYVLEIKIGQGAKPGEGGHLPGSKVTVQVANARNASPGIDLISPSNNHDIYSIEDLAQVIHELRQINPYAKIAVKVPVVPNIGTIAVGIVKAGADIVNLSGFDGGTGAARAHAIRHVGLPVEIGIKLVHEALCEAGLRNSAEIWADGGMKSAVDVMKAILLGANRVGFGTMAMVAIGCTACRACHKDTCHVGIATQMTSVEEAREKGVPSFHPRIFETAVEQLCAFFGAIGEQVRVLTKRLGATRTQDLVGRADLLEQFQGHAQMDLAWLTTVRKEFAGLGTRIVYRDYDAEQAWEEVAAAPLAYAVGTESYAVASAAGVTHAGGAVSRGPRLAEAPAGSNGGTTLLHALRAVRTRESGEHVRGGRGGDGKGIAIHPAVAGNGFAAYHTVGMHSVALGGAQDGTAKGMYGGRVVVLKQRAADGRWRGGSVGKGLAYGAQRGLIIVQGDADARAGIRLSGADLVIGGEVREPLEDRKGWIGARANIKGFAFEYMTAGRALVLGDPGPWICSGMTGGSVYLRHDPEMGLTEEALRRRIAKGAKVALTVLDEQGVSDVTELLLAYHRELRRSGQAEAAKRLLPLIAHPAEHFRMIRPGKDITDQSIATE
ncbi:glutamate synthase-related protein [Alicyclobacillus macrosporangiidus]|uniref:Glutamate synthase (NADPH/NADH) large chain n=1 Tax=Alicyclobacillus macrosporangiidus TaxID=392015 RepID=A0A1I7KWS2_9BACL|nr:glutamate synthase-related protein [Alicyclobacillus macrosporangiidus]SFV01885.1 glutamate synthase (NADPH/NADH) large chain [Alicyclobacillus macrosporangiidus]